MSVRGIEMSSLDPRRVKYIRDNPSGEDEPNSEFNDDAAHRPIEKGRGRHFEQCNSYVPGRKSW